MHSPGPVSSLYMLVYMGAYRGDWMWMPSQVMFSNNPPVALLYGSEIYTPKHQAAQMVGMCLFVWGPWLNCAARERSNGRRKPPIATIDIPMHSTAENV